MRRIIGYALSAVGVLAVAAAIISIGFGVLDVLFRRTETSQNLGFVGIAVSVLGAALGIGLLIIGKHLSGLGGFVFPRIRAYVTSGPVVVAEMIAAAALWGLSAFSAVNLIDLLLNKPYLRVDLVLGIPFGVLIPLAAGFAIYAASFIPAVPAAPDAPPPPKPVTFLGNALAGFGISWLVFAGWCAWSGEFSSDRSAVEFSDPVFLHNVLLSFTLGAVFVTVGLWLRRIASAAPPS